MLAFKECENGSLQRKKPLLDERRDPALNIKDLV